MGAVTVYLPAVLVQIAGCDSSVEVRGDTIQEVLEELVRERPTLRGHLFDETGRMRRHVLCFHNEAYLRRQDDLAVPVAPGDTLTILQSVAGG